MHCSTGRRASPSTRSGRLPEAGAHGTQCFFACAEEEARTRYRRDQPSRPHRQGRHMILVAQDKKARRDSGGPTRCRDLAVGRAGADIEPGSSRSLRVTTADLRIEWRRLYRVTPPTRLSRDLLIRGVTFREHAHGGLSPSTTRGLRSLCGSHSQRSGLSAAPAITLKPGAKLVREWHG